MLPPISSIASMLPAPSPLLAPLAAAVNHLLAQEPWARQQLAPHRGKLACLDTGALALRLRVGADGLCEAAPADAPADVTIRVRLADLPLLLRDRERAFSYVKIEGDAEFANALSQLGKHLRWDAEHELEPLLGPIAARRLVAGARAAAGALGAGRRALAENVAEYFLDEQPLLVRPAAAAAWSADVVRLRDDVERAAKRLAKLEQALARRPAPPRDAP